MSLPCRPPRRLLFLADVAGPVTWHVGDEAMLEANLALFRRLLPEAELVVASGDQMATAARLGVLGVARLDVSAISGKRNEEVDRLQAMVVAVQAGGPAPPVMRALLDADALIISGGGNLCSTWPGHILERLTMARLAVATGRPIFILGQTIGPWLNAEDRPLVSELLGAARWVGVREAASYALARDLGVEPGRLHLQGDDAATLVPAGAPPASARPVVLLTLHPFTGVEGANPRLDALAAELQSLAAAMQAELVFLPHAQPGRAGEPGDLDLADALGRRLPLRVLPMPLVHEAVAAAAGASLIISSRYHPIVFGLGAGVPCLGLPTDEYTRTKLHGTLAGHGQQDALFPLDQSSYTGLAEQALALWQRRDAIRADLATARAAWCARETAREACLRACLAGQGVEAPLDEDWLVSQLGSALAARGEEIARLRAEESTIEEVRHLRVSQREAEAYALDLRDHLARSEAELSRSIAHAQTLFEKLTRLEEPN